MKPIAAVIEQAQVDIDLIAEQIHVALGSLRGAEDEAVRNGKLAERHAAAAESAREAAQRRRVEIGKLLVKARTKWPAERGPGAKGWGEFLARVKIDDATARRYMAEARDPEAFAQRRAKEDADDDEPIDVLGQERDTPPFRQMTEDDIMQAIARLPPEARKRIAKAARINPKGGSGDEDRGTWCTSKEWAIAVGAWDVDPFSNPRSNIASAVRCMLEDDGDAFGGGKPGAAPGLYLTGNAHGAQPSSGVADELTRVWIQPPYELVAEAIAHYGHTRFCALLRWSPDVKAWFPELWARTAVVCHPWCERMEFEPPPGVDKSGDMPFPHALYYAHEADVTDEVRGRCIVWRIDHDLDDAKVPPSAQLHLVR